jgi:endonuclease-3
MTASCEKMAVLEIMQSIWPDPPCFLVYTTDFSLLVAVVLSAQSTDKGVNKVMPKLIAIADTPEKMMNLGKAGLLPIIQSIGLYQRKAEYILGLSQKIVQEHGGRVPNHFQDLVRLPGVGRKTANVVLNILFHHPTIPVDTHVFRVAHRLGFATGKRPEDVEKELQVIPMPWKKNVHGWFILHGRTYCHARFPKCSICPVVDFCQANLKNVLLSC